MARWSPSSAPTAPGKSTLLRAISGLEPLSEGEIRFDGRRIDGTPPEKVVALGIAQAPEGRRVFPDLTVQENLNTGAWLRRDKVQVGRDLDGVFAHFPRLKERRRQWARTLRTLSGGEQQMLAIGRALMSNPRLLLLDEPTIGLSPVLVQEMARIVREIHERGVPVVLVEQNAALALRLATTPTCWRPDPWPCTARPRSFTRTHTSAAPIWVHETSPNRRWMPLPPRPASTGSSSGGAISSRRGRCRGPRPAAASTTAAISGRTWTVPPTPSTWRDSRIGARSRPGAGGCAAAPYVENDGGAPAALMGAVRDALPVPGTTTIDMPVTPEKVWRAIREARARPSGTASDA